MPVHDFGDPDTQFGLRITGAMQARQAKERIIHAWLLSWGTAWPGTAMQFKPERFA